MRGSHTGQLVWTTGSHPLEAKMLYRPPIGLGVGAMDSSEHTDAKYMLFLWFISWEGVERAWECGAAPGRVAALRGHFQELE